MTHPSGSLNESSPVEGLDSSVSADETKARRVASTDVDAPSRASGRPAAPGSRRARREAERAAARAATTGNPDSTSSTGTSSTAAASTVTAEPVAASTVTAEPVAAEQTITAGSAASPEPKQSKAGRNLPAAIGVGAGLLAALGLGLFVFPYLLIALGCLVAGIGSWEVSRALKARRVSLYHSRLCSLRASLCLCLRDFTALLRCRLVSQRASCWWSSGTCWRAGPTGRSRLV